VIGSGKLLSLLSDALVRRDRHLSPAADQMEIAVETVRQGVTRYAGSLIHQTTVVDTLRVWTRVVVGKSVGQAFGTSLEPPDLQWLVEQATSVARRQRPNPEFVSLPPPEPVRPVEGCDTETVEMEPAKRAAAIQTIVEQVRSRGWTASGTYLTEGRELAVVNSLGIAAYAPSSMAFLRALPDSGKGTGYAATWSHRAADLDPNAVAKAAIERCEQNHDQRELSPGEYEAIFGDLCVAEALLYLARHGFSGQAFEEGTSFVSGRLGEKVTGSNVTIWDDATDPRGLAIAADYEGVPKRRLSLIERGVAAGIAYDSYTAQRARLIGDGAPSGGTRQSTGHASDLERSYFGPVPANLFMEGGEASLAEMLAGTRRGLLLTRFHYTHCPDPKRVVMTGTTRDGTFLIENGEIVGAVRDLRLTQSVPELFEGIELLGRPRLCQDWWSSNGMGRLSCVCPPIKVRRATFTSGTRF
jgi:predicted Zn-dependent protease